MILAPRVLAWVLSALSTVMTVGFFVLMAGGSPLLVRAVIGRSVGSGTVVAVLILLGLLACVAIYGRVALTAERRTRDP